MNQERGELPRREMLSDEERYALGRRAANIGIYGNIALALIKGVMAYLTQSISLWADTADTASDTVTSAVVLIGLFIARRPADREHPWGHGRAEPIATLVVAVLLGIVGVQLATRSVGRIVTPVALGGTAMAGVGLLVVAGRELDADKVPDFIEWLKEVFIDDAQEAGQAFAEEARPEVRRPRCASAGGERIARAAPQC